MTIDIEESVKKKKFENRIATGYVDGERITAQVRRNDTKFGGDPYVVAGAAGAKDYERFKEIGPAVERFEEIVEEYGLSE